MKMKIYTIGCETSECYGHGDYGKEVRICREGSYASGDFPPCFVTREFAEQYLAEKKTLFGRVVELDLIVPKIPCEHKTRTVGDPDGKMAFPRQEVEYCEDCGHVF